MSQSTEVFRSIGAASDGESNDLPPRSRPAGGTYCCPGEPGPVSRSVHLGRLASFDPACRDCPHRHDTAGLPTGLRKRLERLERRSASGLRFDDEGIGGTYLNDIDAATARRLAAALGMHLAGAVESQPPRLVVAHDGRPCTASLVAAVSEGLRYAGCGVAEGGAATSAALSVAMGRSVADGGVLIGDATPGAEHVGLRFWGPQRRPISVGEDLDAIRRRFERGTDRPARRFGPVERFDVREDYLALLRPHYHALRPLRVVLSTPCRPLWRYLNELTGQVACEFFDGRPEKTPRHNAHFGIRIDGDAERCEVFDERGQPFPAIAVLAALWRHLLGRSGGTLLLEDETTPEPAAALQAANCRVVTAPSSRSRMFAAMQQHVAALGGGPSGRFWFRQRAEADTDHPEPAADALRLLTYLLVVLSQSDWTISSLISRHALACGSP